MDIIKEHFPQEFFDVILIFVLTYFQAIVFGALQGVTELFPISSLGHSVILPRLLHWHINQNDPFFLTFLVATHAATALVLLLFFLNDWKRIILGLTRSLREREIKHTDSDARLGWLLIVGTMPVGILGLLFEDSLKTLFASPQLVAFVLILNGILLFFAERLRKKKTETTQKDSDERIALLHWRHAIQTGLLQSLALIPGFSRTGAAITGGLLSGLSHEDAVRFTFLLSTPAIGAAAALKLPELFSSQAKEILGPTIVGAIFAGIFAFLSVKFLTQYFETKTLTPFAIYCVVVGVVVSILFFLPV